MVTYDHISEGWLCFATVTAFRAGVALQIGRLNSCCVQMRVECGWTTDASISAYSSMKIVLTSRLDSGTQSQTAHHDLVVTSPQAREFSLLYVSRVVHELVERDFMVFRSATICIL